jgi:hypothetical protein
MRTVDYTADILPQVLALANSNTTDATAADKAKIAQFVQRRGREAWQFNWWPETMESEERTVETNGDRVYVPLDQTDETAIGQVRGCYVDDPLVTRAPRRVACTLSGDNIYLPTYGYLTVYVWFQRVPPADMTASNVIPKLLRDAIAHAAYTDFLRPSAKTDSVPLEATAGYTFLLDESRKLVALQGQAGKWRQN